MCKSTHISCTLKLGKCHHPNVLIAGMRQKLEGKWYTWHLVYWLAHQNGCQLPITFLQSIFANVNGRSSWNFIGSFIMAHRSYVPKWNEAAIKWRYNWWRECDALGKVLLDNKFRRHNLTLNVADHLYTPSWEWYCPKAVASFSSKMYPATLHTLFRNGWRNMMKIC